MFSARSDQGRVRRARQGAIYQGAPCWALELGRGPPAKGVREEALAPDLGDQALQRGNRDQEPNEMPP